MRTIKFRAWDREKREMCIVNRITFMFESENSVMADVITDKNSDDEMRFRRMVMPENLEIMQFTGLNDQNGVDIYEGDIVKGESWKEPYALRTKTEVIGEIVYRAPEFDIKCKLPKGYRTYPTWNNCEIIGNIYENPELLKAE